MHTETIDKRLETRVRRKAARHGYSIAKGRCGHIHMNNLGEFMLVDDGLNAVILGDRYDATLGEIEEWLKQSEV